MNIQTTNHADSQRKPRSSTPIPPSSANCRAMVRRAVCRPMTLLFDDLKTGRVFRPAASRRGTIPICKSAVACHSRGPTIRTAVMRKAGRSACSPARPSPAVLHGTANVGKNLPEDISVSSSYAESLLDGVGRHRPCGTPCKDDADRPYQRQLRARRPRCSTFPLMPRSKSRSNCRLIPCAQVRVHIPASR